MVALFENFPRRSEGSEADEARENPLSLGPFAGNCLAWCSKLARCRTLNPPNLCNNAARMLKEQVMTTNPLLELAELRPTIDLDRREIRHPTGPRHRLSRIESALLSCLLGQAGRPVSRGELLAGVWRLDPLRTVTRTVDMHISMLRKKLGDDSRRPSWLVTVHRVGYMMRPVTTNP